MVSTNCSFDTAKVEILVLVPASSLSGHVVTAQWRSLYIQFYVSRLANLPRIVQVGRDVGLKVGFEEGQPESYHRRQRPESLRDNHSTGGTDGIETPE